MAFPYQTRSSNIQTGDPCHRSFHPPHLPAAPSSPSRVFNSQYHLRCSSILSDPVRSCSILVRSASSGHQLAADEIRLLAFSFRPAISSFSTSILILAIRIHFIVGLHIDPVPFPAVASTMQLVRTQPGSNRSSSIQ